MLKNPAGRAMELPAPLFVQFAEDLALEVWAYEEELKAIGFDMEPFGEGAVRVLAAPETTGEPEIALIAAVEALAGGEGLAKALACKGSKKFGESLSREEMAGLLKDWASCEFRERHTTPQTVNRPTLTLRVAPTESGLGRLELSGV